jgi:hypothetical protein
MGLTILGSMKSIMGASAAAASNSFVVFNASTGPNSSVTGGWYNFYTGGTTNSVMSTTSTTVGLQAPYWCDGVLETNNNINMTGAKFIEIQVSASGVSPPHFYATFGWPLAAGGFGGFSVGNPNDANYSMRTHTIPVTNAGNGKIRLYVTNSNAGFVTLHSIVLKY